MPVACRMRPTIPRGLPSPWPTAAALIAWLCRIGNRRGPSGTLRRAGVLIIPVLTLLAAGCGGGKHGPGPDVTPPGAIKDLRVLAVDDTSITLGWSATGDDGDKGEAAYYDLCSSLDTAPESWATAAVLDTLPVRGPAGTPDSVRIDGLTQIHLYYFAIRAVDAAGNASEFSDQVQARPGDPEPPAAVTDLAVAGLTASTVTLTWTAPGDDGMRGTVVIYDIRTSPNPITDSTWYADTRVTVPVQPLPAGSVQQLEVTGLVPLSVHHYAVRGVDDGGWTAPMGNDLEVTQPPDTTPPAAITDLTAIASALAYRATLTWTAPGDDGMEGKATAYQIRYRMGPITDQATWDSATVVPWPVAPAASGAHQSMEVTDLPGGGATYFAVRAVDESGNLGGLSNPASVYVAGPGRTWTVNVDGSGDAPTVQAAIDSAVTGDAILVGPGRYFEDIDYLGKDVAIRSEEGPEATILDGSRRDSSVVVMTHYETRKAVLEGFTVTGGTGSRFKTDHRQYGGGIHCLGASPTIRGNWIVDNQGFEAGGIGIGPSEHGVLPAPLVEGNLIARNYAPLDGGGMALGDCNAEIRSNVFDSNQAHADGAGIWYWATKGNPVIEGNQFLDNVAGDHGGGIYLGGNHALTQVSVLGNLFVRNRTIGTGFFGDTGSGAAIAALQTDGVIAHNTIVDNDGHHLTLYGGGGLLLWQTRLGMIVQDNIIADNQQCGIACWDRGTTATMRRNLVWHNSGGDLGSGYGTCPRAWADSMIVADPLFCDPASGDYHLAAGSPAIQGKEVMGAFSEVGCGLDPQAAAGSWRQLGARNRN